MAITCVWVYTSIHVYVPWVTNACGSEKKVSDLLVLELDGYELPLGNQIWIFVRVVSALTAKPPLQRLAPPHTPVLEGPRSTAGKQRFKVQQRLCLKGRITDMLLMYLGKSMRTVSRVRLKSLFNVLSISTQSYQHRGKTLFGLPMLCHTVTYTDWCIYKTLKLYKIVFSSPRNGAVLIMKH